MNILINSIKLAAALLLLSGGLFVQSAKGSDTEAEDSYCVLYLNEATPDQLQAVKGIGVKRSEAIIKGRPYAAPADIQKIKGIGPVIAARIFKFALDNWDK